MSSSSTIFLLSICVALWQLAVATHPENLRPIIGVLAQENTYDSWQGLGDTFIRDTYFHFVQQAGARAVPIRIDKSVEYYENLFKSLNGLLLPGGSVSLETSGYAKVARIMFTLAIEAYQKGDIFPIWGTCLGFEQMAVFVDKDAMTDVHGWNETVHLDFVTGEKDYQSTQMYSLLTPELYDYVTKHGATQNMHHQGLTLETYEASEPLQSFFRVLTTNIDTNGQEYVSSMEGFKYPFYGVQYHPEKNIYDWDMNINVDHSRLAVTFTQTLANFFVQKARQSNHRFSCAKEESEAVIDNYQAVFMGKPSYYRVYFFNYTEPGLRKTGHVPDEL